MRRYVTVFILLLVCGAALAAPGMPELSPENFARPPASYRMNVNTHHVPVSGTPQAELLESYVRSGYGGLATNVNWNDRYMHDDAQFDQLFRFVDAARERGLEVWLYDENAYPSGMAGTMILDAHPEWEAEGLFFRNIEVKGPASVERQPARGEQVTAVAVPLTDGMPGFENVIKFDKATATFNIPSGEWILLEVYRDVLYEGFQACTERVGSAPRYPSLLMPEVTEMFTEVTHRRYAQKTGRSLDELFRATFTDEPSSMALPYINLGFGVYPWKENLSREFAGREGVELFEVLPEIALDEGPYGRKLRYTYFSIVSDFMSRNFFGRLRDACNEYGLPSGGHLLVEETMMAHTPLYGSIMACFRQMDIPGIDVLTGMPWFTRRYLYSSRLASSAAELEGRQYVMTEICPIADYPYHNGMEAPTVEVRGTVNRQVVGGVNKYNNYLQLQHEDEAGKDAFNDYVGRLSLFLTGGVRAGRIAVHYPVETVWTKFRPLPMYLESWDKMAGGDPAAQQVDGLFDRVSNNLMDNQWEFSYIDTQAIIDSQIEGGIMKHGALEWDVIILPGTEVLHEGAAARLKDFISAGGTVIAVGSLLHSSPGSMPSETVGGIFSDNTYGNNLIFIPEPQMLNAELEKRLERDVVFSAKDGWLFAHRIIDGEDRYFIVNDTGEEKNVTLGFRGHVSLERWDPANGSITAETGDNIELSLEPYQSMLFRGIKKND